mmetsp:Transcript_16267/g.35273  ORF Transcript_16267/g.35273 Transcript_16267/m.35273 type:complete len:186 (+) Transcript_16267:238-795(+)|eukprot:CAMPEP_0185849412 /NCGR_PEP_ID=MMETSP1354-20130828/3921_1 /TAXON_ID=708628 /ORGANISM="Erythrolobus madagascarensis, Strain CCMP3276" /LENGTH=185 /DNA_ID=CAMNT_0028549927 /DNA_START=238 /DNA_END=795 /DNA_ORIENTATION=-
MNLCLDLDEDALILHRDDAVDGGASQLDSVGGGGFALSVDELTVLPEETQRVALEAFAVHDSDGDGCLTSSELLVVLAKMGYHEGEVITAVKEQQMAKMDAEALLCVLRALVREADPSDQSTRIRKAFDHVDVDGNGVLDFEEFRLLLKMIGRGMTDEAAKEMFNRIDMDGSNSIDYNEFVSSVL